VVRLGCLEASTENTREEGKQEVKLKESWDWYHVHLLAVLKPIPKVALVLTDGHYIY
jgi:hypothetical protein